MKKELLLGYDMRLHPEDCKGDWSKQRKSIYLLNENTEYPLSVDINVWPSIFEFREGNPEAPRSCISSAGKVIAPSKVIVDIDHSGVDAFYNTWSAYEEMSRYASIHEYPANIVPVALTLILTNILTNDVLSYYSLKEKVEMAKHYIPATLSFVGYDIGDVGMISGLTNCGYTKKSKTDIYDKYHNKMNYYGLFDEYHVAHDFKVMTYHRVKSHAPFYVYGIYADLK